MKNMKKGLAWALVCIMLLGLIPMHIGWATEEYFYSEATATTEAAQDTEAGDVQEDNTAVAEDGIVVDSVPGTENTAEATTIDVSTAISEASTGVALTIAEAVEKSTETPAKEETKKEKKTAKVNTLAAGEPVALDAMGADVPMAVAEGGNVTVKNTTVQVAPNSAGKDSPDNWQELTSGTEDLHNGDKLKITIDWILDNLDNSGGTYTYKLDLKGVQLEETTIYANFDGYTVPVSIASDGTMTITISADLAQQKSDIGGKLDLDGYIKVDDNSSKKEIDADLKIEDKDYHVNLTMSDDPSALELWKSNGGLKMQSDGSFIVTYTITAKAKNGPVTGVTFADEWGSDLEWNGETPTWTKTDANGSPVSGANPSYTQSGNTLNAGPFDLADGESMTMTYTLKITPDKVDSILAGIQNTPNGDWDYAGNDNKVKAEYTDDADDPRETDEQIDRQLTPSEPGVGKTGEYSEEDGCITWTVTITGGSSILKDWNLTDNLDPGLEVVGNYTYTLIDGNGNELPDYKDVSIASLNNLDLGDLMEKTLAEDVWNNTWKTGSIKLTYKTKAKAGERDSVFSTEYSNTATITDSDTGYKKSGSAKETDEGVTPESLIHKEATGEVDTINHRVSWTTTLIIPAGAKFNEFKYTDTIVPGHTLVGNQADIDITVMGDNSGVITKKDVTSSSTGFTIDFGDINNSGGEEITITIKYQTEYDEDDATLKTNQGVVTNKGQITFKENDKSYDPSDTATKTVPMPKKKSIQLEKSSPSGEKGYNGKIIFFIKIPLDDFIGDNVDLDDDSKVLELTDTFGDYALNPIDWKYMENSARVIGRDAGSVEDYLGADTNSASGLNVNSSGQNITFSTTIGWLKQKLEQNQTKVTIGYMLEPKDVDAFISGGKVTCKNVVDGKLDNDEDAVKKSQDAWGNAEPEDLIAKSGNYGSGTAPYIYYAVNINKGAYDLSSGDTITVTDTMGEGLEFDDAYPVTVSKYENGAKIEMKAPDEYTLDITGNKLTFTLPDATWIQIEYRAELLEKYEEGKKKEFDVVNTVEITGMKSGSKDHPEHTTGTVVENSGQVWGDTGSVTVYKNNGTSGLQARFKLSRLKLQDGKYVVDEEADAPEFETDQNGYKTIEGLYYDHIYKLEELEAPAHYKQELEPFYFILQGDNNTLTFDGAIDEEGNPIEGSIYLKNDTAGSVGGALVDFKNELEDETNIYISKQNVAHAGELSGATLRLYDADNKYVEWTSGNASKSFEIVEAASYDLAKFKLKPGQYRLHEEVAPKGYTYTTDITFTVDAEGKITGAPTGAVSTDGKTLVMKDNAIEAISISKCEIAGQNKIDTVEIEGASLELYELSDGGTRTKVDSWQSGTAAHTIDGDKLKAGAKYVLVEKTPPTGFEVTTEIIFEVDKDGKITLSNINTNGDADLNGRRLIMYDERTAEEVSIYISKKSITGTIELPGADMKVYKKGDDTKAATWTTVATGPKEFKIVTEKADVTKYELEPGVTYVLEETVAPSGYTYADNIEFSVDANGKITATGGTVSGKTLTMKDSLLEIYISKRILNDTEGKELVGAEFEVRKGTNVVDSWKQTAASPHLLQDPNKLLEIGTDVEYELVETKAPEGYKLNTTPIKFKISKSGEIVPVGSLTNAAVNNKNTIIVYDEMEDGVIFISKRKVTGTDELEGASLTLYKKNTDGSLSEVDSWVSGKSAKSIKLDAGTYVLKETGAPDGYTYAEQVEFTVDADGKITDVSGGGKQGADDRTVIMVDNAIGNVKVSKKSIAGDVVGEDELKGATFVLLEVNDGKEGKQVDGWTSDGKVHEIDGTKLKVGQKYVLKETVAPDGYTVTTDIYFEVDEDGNIKLSSVNTNGDVTLDADGRLIEVHDRAIDNIKISKRDLDGGDELAGATFVLYEVDSKGNKTSVATWKSDGTDHEIDGKLLKGGTTYVLEETGAPDGYEVTTTITFKVNKDGSVDFTLNTNGDAKYDKDGRTITVYDRAKSEEEVTTTTEEETTKETTEEKTTEKKTTEKKTTEQRTTVEQQTTQVQTTATTETVTTTSKKTGDAVPIAVMVCTMLLSAAGFILLRKEKRK